MSQRKVKGRMARAKGFDELAMRALCKVKRTMLTLWSRSLEAQQSVALIGVDRCRRALTATPASTIHAR